MVSKLRKSIGKYSDCSGMMRNATCAYRVDKFADRWRHYESSINTGTPCTVGGRLTNYGAVLRKCL